MNFRFLPQGADLSLAHTGTYNFPLVVVSCVIAVLGAYAALKIVAHIRHTRCTGKVRWGWILAGALALGNGIWSMHFIGMLAFSLPDAADYDIALTVLSGAVAVIANVFVINIVSKPDFSLKRIAVAATILGGGIAAMHYIGVSAMIIDDVIYYDPFAFLISILAGLLFSFFGLFVFFADKRPTFKAKIPSHSADALGALLLGSAISATHYIAMSATYFFHQDVPHPHGPGEVHGPTLGIAVAMTAILVVGLSIIATIIDRHLQRAMVAAQESRTAMFDVMRAAPQGILVLDKKLDVVLYNDAFAELFRPINRFLAKGATLRTLLRSWCEAGIIRVPSSGVDTYIEDRARRLAGTSDTYEEQFQDGRWFSVSVKQTIRGGTIALWTEITKHKLAEIQSRSREDYVRKIIDNIISGVVIVDGEGTVLMFNGVAESIFDYERSQVLGKNITSLISSAAKTPSREGASSANLDTAPLLKAGIRELQGVRKDETRFPIEVGVSELHTEQGRQYIIVVTDISQRKQDKIHQEELERELLHASKMEAIGLLAGGIAHEINTPTQYIGDNLTFLQDVIGDILTVLRPTQDLVSALKEGSSPESLGGETLDRLAERLESLDIEYLEEDIPQAIEQSLNGVRDVARIVLSMKEFSHPSTKEKTFADINGALKNTMTVSRNEWKHVADIELDLDETLPQIQCLPGEINQVLLNMIVNATHAIEAAGATEKGKITLSTRAKDDVIEIGIADTGSGMPPDVQKRIFEPFFTTKGVGKGTGQGLAISWDIIVNKHGGNIQVHSTPGEGTTFIIQLPLATPEGDADANTA